MLELFKKTRSQRSESSSVAIHNLDPGHGLKIFVDLLATWKAPFKFVHHDDTDERNTKSDKRISNPLPKLGAASKSDTSVRSERKEATEQVRRVIDSVTDSIMQRIVEEKNEKDAFDRNKLPNISLNDYLYRLVRYLDKWFKEEPSVNSVGMRSLFLALVYIDQVQKIVPDFQLNEYNVHRLFLVSMLVAAKFTEDKPISNQFWAKVGGIDMKQVNSLESSFCSISEYKLYVSDDELNGMINQFVADDVCRLF
mmetsp:Transcript_383/g.455  ORF Transcript_383/g.455 Transcript_383/m.455 type:complete len:253 (-) Transcript_383:106-864(-)|eukprot:CAMPEP_0184069174 /NCGR_PEP_ID=MMETSP0957-20130417/40173_1 /TAXON_ID=627963 /ORGANISM="Aplanochytrium sp, Strain PBS07" /LENGTH=252 /DNA_ID=CAMNT_0026368481 /DNA_START=286 /DNA_END=1044 /DNA_ORIENTATION=+